MLLKENHSELQWLILDTVQCVIIATPLGTHPVESLLPQPALISVLLFFPDIIWVIATFWTCKKHVCMLTAMTGYVFSTQTREFPDRLVFSMLLCLALFSVLYLSFPCPEVNSWGPIYGGSALVNMQLLFSLSFLNCWGSVLIKYILNKTLEYIRSCSKYIL